MTRPIAFYLHHHGSGHVTRGLQIARACRREVVGLSTAPRPPTWPGRWICLPDDASPASEGADPSAGGALHRAPLAGHPFGGRMRRLASVLIECDPALMYVDVSVEVTLLARLLGIPVVVAAMRGDRTDPPHQLAYDVAHTLLAPWPASADETFTVGHHAAKTCHVGGISRFDVLNSPTAHHDRQTVFVLWGAGGGEWPPEVWQEAKAATPGWSWKVGADAADVHRHLSAAEVVITHAGQNAVAEVAAARRPALVVALDRPHGEQAATAAALQTGGFAETVDATRGVPTLDWAVTLKRVAARDGDRWAAWSDGFGAHRAASALEAAARGRRLAPRTAVITPAHGRHTHLRRLIAGVERGTHLPERLIVVALDDPEVSRVATEAASHLRVDVLDVPSSPAGLPLAQARNRGAQRAADLGCEQLIFLDVDCIPSRHLVAAYAQAMTNQPRREPTIWSGPVAYLPAQDDYDLDTLDTLGRRHTARPAPAPGEVVEADDLRLFWSLSFAMSAAHFAHVGGFDEEYCGYGGEDTDFAMRLRAHRGRLFWLGGADAYHQHHPTQVPPVQHLRDIVRNANLFHRRWGFHPMEGWLEVFAERGLVRYHADTSSWQVVEAT